MIITPETAKFLRTKLTKNLKNSFLKNKNNNVTDNPWFLAKNLVRKSFKPAAQEWGKKEYSEKAIQGFNKLKKSIKEQ